VWKVAALFVVAKCDAGNTFLSDNQIYYILPFSKLPSLFFCKRTFMFITCSVLSCTLGRGVFILL